MGTGDYAPRNPYLTGMTPIPEMRSERQASAEFNEAMGQLNQAANLYFQGYVNAHVRPNQHRQYMDQTSKELAAHKIREAITNLQDVVRFMELP